MSEEHGSIKYYAQETSEVGFATCPVCGHDVSDEVPCSDGYHSITCNMCEEELEVLVSTSTRYSIKNPNLIFEVEE